MDSTTNRLLYLIDQYRKAMKGGRAREHEARERLFEYAQEVTDRAESAELDAGRGRSGEEAESYRIQRMGAAIRISPAGHDSDSQT